MFLINICNFSIIVAFVSCYFMGTACRGGTVDACFVHNVTYMPV